MARLTNDAGIDLALAVWLATDGYDFRPEGKSISATALLKPVRQIILSERQKMDGVKRPPPDISDFIASRYGHAFHDSIENAWKAETLPAVLRSLGYSKELSNSVLINPEGDPGNYIPCYLEVRSQREIYGYTISGKFDFCLEGVIQDFKSTATYAFTKRSKDNDYIIQGSIYRWLNPDKVTEDYMKIHFIFTDWQGFMAKQNPDYPQQRVATIKLQLMSIEETEAWIINKLKQLEDAADLDEKEIPFCSDEELWRSDTVWKYYSNPAKTEGRATKNFTDEGAAKRHMATAGKGKGVILKKGGEVKACGYCPAFDTCTQKDLYEHS